MFNRFGALTMKGGVVAAVAALLAAALLVLWAAPDDAAAQRGQSKKTSLSLSAQPESLEISSCLPASTNVGLQNTSSEPVYADAFVGAQAPLEASREVISSYLPAGYKLTVPVRVSVPEDAATGTYDLSVEAGRERLSVPVAVVAPERCVFEAESLLPPTEATADARAQNNCCGIRWSGDAQLWFLARSAGQHFTVAFDVPNAGTYDLSSVFTKAPDYGIHTLSIDGQRVGEPFDGYDPAGVTTQRVNYGAIQLEEGRHTVTLTVTGKNANSRGFFAGVDLIELDLQDPAR